MSNLDEQKQHSTPTENTTEPTSRAHTGTRQVPQYADSGMSGKAFTWMIAIFGLFTLAFCIGVFFFVVPE